jgi:hypothetical protein
MQTTKIWNTCLKGLLKMSKDLTVKERLAIMETKQDDLIKHFTNHLHQHYKLVWGFVTVAVTAVIEILRYVIPFVTHLIQGHNPS